MKKLAQQLRKNGFVYILIQRGLRSCIYAQKISEIENYYEVFLIKIKPETKIKEKILEALERFPTNESFGSWAWSFMNYHDALRKFLELERRKTCD